MRTVATLCRELTVDRRNDGELLAAFISHSSEEAFAELIRRHGPLVWGACRRLLPNPADAEDAFQAAFLVLVRRANGLTRTPTLGPWLHRVAVWTARNVRRKNARRFARQTELPEHVTDPAAPPDTDLKADLDSALLALPSRYRDSIILCHLQGFSRREAAERLGCAEGTLSGWLHRGLAKLRDRLPAFDPKVLGVVVAVPTVLAASTVHAAIASTVAAATVPPAVNSLVEGVLHMFWVKKATAASVALFATFALGIGIGVGGRSDYSAATASEGGGAVAVAVSGEEKSAPVAQPKDAPPNKVEDLPALLLQIKKQLSAAEAEVARSMKAIETAEEQLRAAMASGNKELIAEASKKLDQASKSLPPAQAEYEALRRAIPRLEEKLKATEPEKPATPQPKEVPPARRDLAKEIRDLEAKVREREAEHMNNLAAVEAIRAKIQALDRAKSAGKATEEEVNEAFRAYSNIVRKGEDNARQLIALKERLAALKAELAKAEGAKLTRGHLELTVGGKASDYVFELKETDANGRVIGIVTVRDTSADVVMLGRLLARTKADPTAPTELRVVAQPQTSLGFGPRAALKASNTAGFKTVKFSGYVFGGGFAQEIQPDQKGDVPGYNRYDAAEKKPDELLKEIEEGMRRY
jgi:RNA polymerase sigma factor (sigma-70 family)